MSCSDGNVFSTCDIKAATNYDVPPTAPRNRESALSVLMAGHYTAGFTLQKKHAVCKKKLDEELIDTPQLMTSK